jgi:hypothetical protein
LVSGTFSVSPGQALKVIVAGIGGLDWSGVDEHGYGYGTGGSGTGGGGRGGGASSIADGGRVLLVAGGGGGGGGESEGPSCRAGDGAWASGEISRANPDAHDCPAGVTPSRGGVYGAAPTRDGADAAPVVAGVAGGGGGGGGYRGGTAGAGAVVLSDGFQTGGGGGGAGTSYLDQSGTNLSGPVASHRNDGGVLITYAVPLPTATPRVVPAPNAAGWVRGPARVDWNWGVAGSSAGVGACAPSAQVSGAGVQTLSASCTDASGRTGSASMVLHVDGVAPVDKPVVTKSVSGVSVDWHWTDATSGVDTAHCVQSTSKPGTGVVTVTSSCADVAGNGTTDTVRVDNDWTGPADTPLVTPAANAAGWRNSDVTVAWLWTDDDSGVDPAHCTSVSTSSGDGAAVPVSTSCSDRAGNVTHDAVTVKVDTHGPLESPMATETTTGVTVVWNWSDALSGVDQSRCPSSSSLTGWGWLTFTATCADIAGNVVTATKWVYAYVPH